MAILAFSAALLEATQSHGGTRSCHVQRSHTCMGRLMQTVDMHACMRARACAWLRVPRACMRADVHACTCVRARVRACVRVCARAFA
eukprot:4555653-Alexandrium_andersonii.AAC.1